MTIKYKTVTTTQDNFFAYKLLRKHIESFCKACIEGKPYEQEALELQAELDFYSETLQRM